MTSQYSLAPAVNLRFEPQYYESYVAFNYKTASTTFLTADEHGVLEYIRRKPASPEEISTASGRSYSVSASMENCIRNLIEIYGGIRL